jgi:ADP-ribose pyrophosphatase YjhB (NUDIX family)
MSGREVTGQPAGPSVRTVPAGDTQERLVCPDCGYINYENPKVVVGSVALWDGRILLCRRAIHPRKGFWTLPAGYLELNETASDGAKREAREEARAELDIRALLAVYSIPRISQIQLIYLADLVSPEISAGPESESVGLFHWDEIPWGDIAFPSVVWALNHYDAVKDATHIVPQGNPPGEPGQME